MEHEFEQLLLSCRDAIERFVFFRMPSRQDAEDVLQEIYLKGYQSFDQLKSKNQFKAWMLQIARNKCHDYFRARVQGEIPVAEIPEYALTKGRCGIILASELNGTGLNPFSLVEETLEQLTERSREILRLYYLQEMSQHTLAEKLGIPVGTVKSRLHYAKKEFREKYPGRNWKGEITMSKLPEMLPEYTIEQLDGCPFSVKWEELMGWFIVPRTGEKLSWGMYDFPERKLTESVDMEVVGRAEVHGIEGVEITAVENNLAERNCKGGKDRVSRRFVAQLTDTHCRFLAESHMQDGVRKNYTFLDGDAFLGNWGFGEDNCGNEIHIAPKGDIIREGMNLKKEDKEYLLDVVGRYKVTLGGREYDTICVVDIETYNPGVLSEQYLDQEGRTILWRRFNRDDWGFQKYGKKWSEQLPDNERLLVNGETFIHWYDCVTDYVFR